MSKKSVLCVLLSLGLVAGLSSGFAQHGITFSADVSTSLMLKPYVGENVAYTYTLDNGVAFGGGVRVIENFWHNGSESIIYTAPYAEFGYKWYFLDLGALLANEYEHYVMFYGRTGFNFGGWSVGRTKISVLTALEISPTLFSVEAESDGTVEGQTGAAIGSAFVTAFGSVFNIVKLCVGVTCYLPIK